MSQNPGQDPGGGPPVEGKELSDVQDQVLIAHLKEVLKKNDQSNLTQEKVEEYMNTLSKISVRVKQKSSEKGNSSKKTVDIPPSEKLNLLKQQLEENKAKLAERGKSQKGIEEMVSQLKAQLDDSQQLINQSGLNLSLQEKVDYSPSYSSEELYSILLSKEKRITELVSKVQKLETNVLDLQENLKEKDSVIDARTKAITLMTESLSRKGKNTLDALEDTKQQMRKMQENFISLESEMKARQLKLLDDLKNKNYEIAELQELNSVLSEEKNQLVLSNSLLKEESSSKSENNNYNVEIQALQQKLDNKINETEQLSHTIKELEEKIGDESELDRLRKQLEENNKHMIKVKAQHKSKVKELNKKIESFKNMGDLNASVVKLEGENCKLNQKIAELEEEKGSLQLKLVETDHGKGVDVEHIKELECKIVELQKLLDEKDEAILLLDNEMKMSKNEIEMLAEKLTNLSHLENVQVTSQITSIQFEEQLDSLEHEKQQLVTENTNIIRERDELLEKVDVLSKEKQDVSLKLEHYVQENMELVDKLEKLSAEKVSSAESIEIVEGLTQQEKLELEAYQKNITLKGSEENLPQNVDLNESVNELTEETSELLQKIELFTVERREVMEKMELLSQENNQLNLKIKEIENNRDILAETYEQLQTEKDSLNETLQILIKENDEMKLKVYENNADLAKELEEKIQNYQSSVNDNKTKLENLESFINELECKLEERQIKLSQYENENEILNNNIVELNRIISNLENENKSLLNKMTQLEELNSLIAKEKVEEVGKLLKERDNLQQLIKEKDETFHKVGSELKEKYLTMQRKLEENSDRFESMNAPLNAKIEELTQKNKEQLEKMKKIAANLKKKSQAYQELEEMIKSEQEKWQNEFREKDLKISSLVQQLEEVEKEFTRIQLNLDEKSEQLTSSLNTLELIKQNQFELESKNVELQNILVELRVKAEKNEINLQQELLLTQENLVQNQMNNESKLQSKIQELEMVNENLEFELSRYRERISKLEEDIAFVEERRMNVEEKAHELGVELLAKSTSIEEISQTEHLLEKRLAALTVHDQAIEKKLQEQIDENHDLIDNNKKLEDANQKLRHKLELAEEKNNDCHLYEEKFVELETRNAEMAKSIEKYENDLRKMQGIYERMIEENNKINNDWQLQYDEICKERNELLVKCEKFNDRIGQIEADYEFKLEKSQNDVQNLTGQLHNKYAEVVEIEAKFKIELDKSQAEMQRILVDSQHQNEIQSKLEQSRKEVDELNGKIVDLEQQLMQQTAEIAVNSDKSQVEEQLTTKMEQPKSVSSYMWSEQKNDPFAFVSDQSVEKVMMVSQQNPLTIEIKTDGNSQEELLNKIKTLEFMLFNVEKEKDEALMQCNKLSGEVTRLVYERENVNEVAKSLEAQILKSVDVVDRKELEKIEFEPTNPAVQSSVPVVEDKMHATTAYLCYDNDENPQEPQEENVVQSKNIAASYNVERENDDGWGWGPDEAKLEEEYMKQSESAPIIDSLRQQIRVFEIERENHLDEIKQLQIKSGKLIKKLKEFKQKLTKKSESNLLNLDDTMQEEFKLQIEQIEKKLKETTGELEKERAEKSAILKRIDVLTSANERLIEMKEKQDVEMFSWQRNCRELQQKLEQFEWGDDGFVDKQPIQSVVVSDTDKNNDDLSALKNQIDELNATIRELTLDNEELQALLEEQRNLRINAEKSKTIPENDYIELNEKLRVSGEEKKRLENEINNLIKQNGDLINKCDVENAKWMELEREKQAIFERLQNNNDTNKEIQEKLTLLENENIHLINTNQEKIDELIRDNEKILIEKKQEIENLSKEKQSILMEKNGQIEFLQNELSQLMHKLETNQFDEQTMEGNRKTIDELSNEKQQLFDELQEKIAQIESMKTFHQNQLDVQIESNRNLLEEKQNELRQQLINEFDLKLTAKMEQLTREWEMRVDQRGNDVADSWKLHVDGRETEFAQLESLLRKEINELEEKCNGLVNENNELRKNVDAEIRNEVDRVSALQQQINDRQSMINELNRNLHDKQVEIDESEIQIAVKQEILNEIVENFEKNSGSTIIPDKENIIMNLQQLFTNIALLKRQIDEKSNECSTLQMAQDELRNTMEEKNQQIAQLNSQLEEVQNLKDYEGENTRNLQQNLQENVVHLQEVQRQLQQKDVDIGNLRELLDEKERQVCYVQENVERESKILVDEQQKDIDSLKRRLIEMENNYEELLLQKDADLNSVQIQLKDSYNKIEDYSERFDGIESELVEKRAECASFQHKIDEQQTHLDNENKQLTELKSIIEAQVLKIENLKGELYQKCNDYDSLIAQMDIGRQENAPMAATTHSSSPPIDRDGGDDDDNDDDDLSEPVNRAELDLALYMLHQRDVRCEELTVELTQLLEERDTLQLRLSNAIREKEELAKNARKDDETETATTSVETKNELVQEPSKLATKLSELRTVGYKRDKTIVDEQELRRLQELTIMQQHRDVASKLPPEAAARLVDASYTLSRDVQSPSKVLLNWLWGRSTPKVNDI